MPCTQADRSADPSHDGINVLLAPPALAPLPAAVAIAFDLDFLLFLFLLFLFLGEEAPSSDPVEEGKAYDEDEKAEEEIVG